MRCAQCHEHVGGNWVEWAQRHLVPGLMVTTTTAVILCPPPRVCAQEWAEAQVNTEAVLRSHESADEPF